jgi:hypothetical protein
MCNIKQPNFSKTKDEKTTSIVEIVKLGARDLDVCRQAFELPQEYY